MARNNPNHVHRYKKANLARRGDEPYWVYRCVKPTCHHYIRLEFAEGKACECHRCGDSFIINKTTLTKSNGGAMARPHCNDCVKKKVNKDLDSIAAFLVGQPNKVE